MVFVKEEALYRGELIKKGSHLRGELVRGEGRARKGAY